MGNKTREIIKSGSKGEGQEDSEGPAGLVPEVEMAAQAAAIIREKRKR